MLSKLPVQIGTAFALSAFAVALGSGLVAHAEPSQVLIRSVVVLIGATAIGRVFGHCVRTTLVEHIGALTAEQPLPEPIPVPTTVEDRGAAKATEVQRESP